MIRIAIADDHRMFIDGLCSLFSESEKITVIHTAGNGKELMRKIASNPVDVVLIDSDMPVMNGLETTRLLQKTYPEIKVIVLTMHAERNHIQNFIQEGAKGYILKNTSKSELEDAIPIVVSGESYYSREVSNLMMSNLKKHPSDEIKLSEREIDVLKLIAEEFTTKEIADRLFISQNTVETHRKNLISKSGAKNVVGLVKYAIKSGILKS